MNACRWFLACLLTCALTAMPATFTWQSDSVITAQEAFAKGKSSGGKKTVSVKSYSKKDGARVSAHKRSAPKK